MTRVTNTADTSAVLGDATIPDVNTVLYDASGNAIDSHLDADGGYHLGVAVSQSVYADPNNSSTTNLAAATYTFTGTGTSTLGVVGLQFSTDLRLTVTAANASVVVNYE